MAYACDSEDGNQAVLLVTDLTAGDTLAMCPACLPAWVAVMNNELNGPGPELAPATPTDPATGDESDEDEHADGMAGPGTIDPGLPAPADPASTPGDSAGDTPAPATDPQGSEAAPDSVPAPSVPAGT